MKKSVNVLLISVCVLLICCKKNTLQPDAEKEKEIEEVQQQTKKYRSWKGHAYEGVIQKSGKIVLLGYLGKSGYNENKTLSIYRLNRDSVLDQSFNASYLGDLSDGKILWNGLAVQQDDKILVGGEFKIDGEISRLVRLSADGTLDKSFSLKHKLKAYVISISISNTGDIYVITQREFFKLKPDGSVDDSFNFVNESLYPVNRINFLTNGKMMVIGTQSITRINSDGSKDRSFNFKYIPKGTGGIYPSFGNISFLKNGQFFLSGSFSSLADADDDTKTYNYSNIARFNADGSLDQSFKKIPNANNSGIFMLSDDSFLFTETTNFYQNAYKQTLHHVDLNGTTISQKEIWGWNYDFIKVSDTKVLLVGNFFQEYDNLLLLFDQYASDSRPVIELNVYDKAEKLFW